MTVEKLLQLGRKGFSTQIHAETLAFDKSILLAEMQAKAELNPELKPFVVAYLSASQDHHWFHAHPAAHGTQLRNDEWRFAICLCFGLPIWDPTRLTIGFHTPHSTCNQCKVNMGEFAAYGFHAFHCPYLRGAQVYRHNTIRDGVVITAKRLAAEHLRNAEFDCEYLFDHLFPGQRKDQGQVVVPRDAPFYTNQHGIAQYQSGQLSRIDLVVTNPDASPVVGRIAVDFTVVSCVAKMPLRNSDTLYNLAHTANFAEKKKVDKVNEQFNAPVQNLLGAGIEVFGAMGRGCNQAVATLANFVSPEVNKDEPLDDPKSVAVIKRGRAVTELRTSIQVNLFRGNARCIQQWISRCCVGKPRLSTNHATMFDNDVESSSDDEPPATNNSIRTQDREAHNAVYWDAGNDF